LSQVVDKVYISLNLWSYPTSR